MPSVKARKFGAHEGKRYQNRMGFRGNMAGEKANPEGSQPTHPDAKQDDDGVWRDADGRPLRVSASDLERFTYCPMSWHLAATGTKGKSAEIEQGIQDHQAIHASITELQTHQLRVRRNLLIWRWWFGVSVVLLIDTVAFRSLDDSNFDIEQFSRLLAAWAVSCLVVGMAAVFVPWRSLVGFKSTYPELQQGEEDDLLVEPVFEPRGFTGGWMEGGFLEAATFMGAIVLSLHAMALQFASNKEQASYVLAVTTIVWTLAASYRLQRALISNNEAQILAAQNNLSSETKIAYSDDEESSSLLIDEATGLRGRPDQIVIIDSEFIPVEQKTGRVPKKPHDSHVMQALAYAALVETTTGRSPPYALLRYGPDNLHQIEWDDASKTKLFDGVMTIQAAMAQGGAHRNHERPGKCKNCSRRYACDQRLV